MRAIVVGSFSLTKIRDYSFFENFSTKEHCMNFTTHSALWAAGNLYVSLKTFPLLLVPDFNSELARRVNMVNLLCWKFAQNKSKQSNVTAIGRHLYKRERNIIVRT